MLSVTIGDALLHEPGLSCRIQHRSPSTKRGGKIAWISLITTQSSQA